MSTELYLTPTWAKVPPTSKDYVEKVDDPKKAAWREKIRYAVRCRWAKPGAREKLSERLSIAVDAFTLDGKYIGTFKNPRLAAEILFPGAKYGDRRVSACRSGHSKKTHGYMFRYHVDNPTDIEPYQRKTYTRKSPKNVRRKMRPEDTYLTRAVGEVCEFGVLQEWPSVKACAEELHISVFAVYMAIKRQKPCGGTRYPLQYLGKPKMLKENEKNIKKMVSI